MSRLTKVFSLHFTLVAFFILQSNAEETLLLEGSSYQIKNGSITYESPYVIYKDMEISSKFLTYDSDKKTLDFREGITLLMPEVIVSAERLMLDLNQDSMVFHHAAIFHKSNTIYIQAKKIEKTGPLQFTVYEAEITQCDPEKPAWNLYAQKMIYNLDAFAYSWNTNFFLYSVPLFYSPVLAWSTKQNRASGFLPSEIVFSNTLGNRLKIPYFLELDKEHDLTFTLDFIEKQGTGVALDYNYAFVKGMKGKTSFWGIEEISSRLPDDEYLMDLDDDATLQRYSINYKHQQYFLDSGKFLFQYSMQSDNEIRKDYLNSATSLETKNQKKLDFSYPWDSGGGVLSFDSTETFLKTSRYSQETDEDISLRVLPHTNLIYQFDQIFDAPISVNFDLEATEFQRNHGYAGERLRLFSQVLYDSQIAFLGIKIKLGNTNTLYNTRYIDVVDGTADPNPASHQFSYSQNQGKLEINTEFYKYRISEKRNNIGRWSMKPRLIYQYTQDIDQRNTLDDPSNSLNGDLEDYAKGPIFDDSDQILSRNSLSLIYEVKYQDKNKQAKEEDIFILSLDQSFNLNRKNSETETENSFDGPQPDNDLQETKYGEQQVPLRLNIYYKPFPNFNTTWSSRYNQIKQTSIERNWSARLSGIAGNYLSFSIRENEYSYVSLNNEFQSEVHQVNLSGKYQISPDFSFDSSNTWDLNRNDKSNDIKRLNRNLTNSSSSLTYNQCCYLVTFSYKENIKTKFTNEKEEEYLDRIIAINFKIDNFF